jgi:NTE family protein
MMATRALVLGGGGLVGIAWETGVLAGLSRAGIEPNDADLVIGTSAGSVVGAQIRMGRTPESLLAVQSTPSDGRIEQNMANIDAQALMAIFAKWGAAREMTPALCAEIGAMALNARTGGEAEWLAGFDALIGNTDWPPKPYVATAVDAQNGAFATWDITSGVPLQRAVASSCAVPGMFPPVTINGRRYVDGGVRSGTNADQAQGHDVVVIVAPIGASAEGIGGIARRQLDAEAAALRAGGSAVTVVLPDPAAMEAFGPNLMDPSRRAAAAEAGVRQGGAVAESLRSPWTGAAV